MRRFGFESEMYQTLSCLPMMVRDKLDRAALKVSQRQWLSLELHKRRLIYESPADTE